ncbi:MAG: hypothetical protein QM763_10775 [Agriterribacter sp.]
MKKIGSKKNDKAIEAKGSNKKIMASKSSTRGVAKGSSGSKSEPKIT